jgi:beta-galactosidase
MRAPSVLHLQQRPGHRLVSPAVQDACRSAAKRYFLQFDGVGAVADVWLNGHYLGKHAGAFSRFRFDASRAIRSSVRTCWWSKPTQPSATRLEHRKRHPAVRRLLHLWRHLSQRQFDRHDLCMQTCWITGPGLYARVVAAPASPRRWASATLINDGQTSRMVNVETRIEATRAPSSRRNPSGVGIAGPTLKLDTRLHIDRPRLWPARRTLPLPAGHDGAVDAGEGS